MSCCTEFCNATNICPSKHSAASSQNTILGASALIKLIFPDNPVVVKPIISNSCCSKNLIFSADCSSFNCVYNSTILPVICSISSLLRSLNVAVNSSNMTSLNGKHNLNISFLTYSLGTPSNSIR
eukprot:NODE_416_length_9017_cov_0.133326.p3 type:complete len:125 gc:universal NODE_416_length_9017_cov_0.133326:2994-2620(-)